MPKYVERVRNKSFADLKRMSIPEATKFFQPRKPFNFGETAKLKQWLNELGIKAEEVSK